MSEWVLVVAVFRRDTIDATHSPVFHQMEGVETYRCPRPVRCSLFAGVRIWPKSEGIAVVDDLQEVLEGMRPYTQLC